ncbi:alpha/beta hydrolase [Nostoc sp. FACHB-280]|uniref:alpha/beta hydrolase n=1 Tax=Nostoc sp. FACHB-280 TaxID=2692839 RepID=UPI00168B8877|nr:alpha/beta hydrolase [Nostoc sp. FACHB-280]MBD2494296.1 alpha/beta hydrolase [Nostoc sp. FACHB-280]
MHQHSKIKTHAFIAIKNLHKSLISRLALSLFCAVATTQFTPAKAANTVYFNYGISEEFISVKELQTIADTGKIPDNYQRYLKQLPPEQRSLIIEALKQSTKINFVTLSKLLNTNIGSKILQDLSKVTIRKDAEGLQALRAALVTGSKNGELSIIKFIQAYPSENIRIDIKQAFEVLGNLNKSYQQTQQFVKAISPQLSGQKPNLNLPLDPSQLGSGKVQLEEFNWNDQKRQRQVPVDLYWSSTATSAKPVIILSHGYTSGRKDMRYLAEHLASHGYVVAAIEHIGSNQAYQIDLQKPGIAPPLMNPKEFLERPKDISFVLDELAKLNQKANSPLQNKLATDRAIVIGHSFGGGTALSIAGAELQIDYLKQRCQKDLTSVNFAEGLQCKAAELPENRYQLRDPRVKQVIALNPTSSLMFGKTGLQKVEIPTLVLASSEDKTAPALTEQVIGFNQIPSPKWLVGIIGATHASVKDPNTTMEREEKKQNSVFGGGEVVGEQAADIRKYMKAIALAFAAQMTPEAKEYAIFLTPEYARFASTQAFPICLVTQLSPDILAQIQALK